ncbi:hypothetical protein [Azohydromonas caseinilytica]|uniref:Uncharacterized protein n=1 Tax=Azohydromonas caseinilytica TaxID=2728836 RepID=A0A848FJH5_9BURK|nr:hypothetical protein [Azohydromonas caseinilytica]NML18393.1 hypothetical protein [Azohydromonas caseinilytica]
MRTERSALLGERPDTDLLHRLDGELQALQARIAQLSIALRVPLETAADVERVLQRPPAPPVAVERRNRGGGSPDYRGPERRSAHLWDELRALLVLRYQLCSRLAGAVGAKATQELLDAANAQLQREGFGPAMPDLGLSHVL